MSDTDAVAVAAVAAAERVAGHEERTGASLFFNARLYPSAEASAAEPSSAAASSDAAAETDLRCTASWMIVGEDGRVVETGDDANVPSDRSMFKQCIDMEGRTVLPGLIDAHIHVLMTGRFAFQVDMRGCTSIEAFQQRLREGIKQQEERVASATPAASSVAAASEPQQAQSEEWIVGIGWEQDELGRYPTRADIDAVEPNRPVLLWRICSHICLVCTLAQHALLCLCHRSLCWVTQ
jgi:predicted amidohydrolase YtcJ